jgi:hypothetical protein
MNRVKLFRVLVIGSTALYIVWLALPWFEERFVAIDTWDVLSWHGFGALLPMPTGIAWLTALLYIAVAIGLCGFSPAARWLFVALTVFSYSWTLLSGLHVETALSRSMASVAALADGAILVLAYTMPLAGKFERAMPLADPDAPPNGGSGTPVSKPGAWEKP